jgi:hypothetical protein
MHPANASTPNSSATIIRSRYNDTVSLIALLLFGPAILKGVPSSSAVPANYNPDSLKNNRQIKREGHILQVEQVVFQLVVCILDA